MIKEYCDRCKRPVGRMFDGGKDEPRIDVAKYISRYVDHGRGTEFIVCGQCDRLLSAAVCKWFHE